MHDVVDLRSDTLTLPTPEMREAMARAEVGDDVWGEDPTASIRCVTHKDIDADDITRALEGLDEITKGW